MLSFLPVRQRNLKAPKNQEKSEKNARTNMTFLKCVPEKQESTVYFVWSQRLFPVMYDPFAPRRSLNRETLTVGVVAFEDVIPHEFTKKRLIFNY